MFRTRCGELLTELRRNDPHGRSRQQFTSWYGLSWGQYVQENLENGDTSFTQEHLDELVEKGLVSKGSDLEMQFKEALRIDEEDRTRLVRLRKLRLRAVEATDSGPYVEAEDSAESGTPDELDEMDGESADDSLNEAAEEAGLDQAEVPQRDDDESDRWAPSEVAKRWTPLLVRTVERIEHQDRFAEPLFQQAKWLMKAHNTTNDLLRSSISQSEEIQSLMRSVQLQDRVSEVAASAHLEEMKILLQSIHRSNRESEFWATLYRIISAILLFVIAFLLTRLFP
jgi:hypothetical protein